MARDHRIVINGQPIPFSCENYRFLTALDRGKPHGNISILGSVTGQPLLTDNNGYTLWLEHANPKFESETEFYWLMWYDPNGMSTIPMSGVFDRDQLIDMVRQLMQFVP